MESPLPTHSGNPPTPGAPVRRRRNARLAQAIGDVQILCMKALSQRPVPPIRVVLDSEKNMLSVLSKATVNPRIENGGTLITLHPVSVTNGCFIVRVGDMQVEENLISVMKGFMDPST